MNGYEYAMVIVLYLLVGCALGLISKLRQRVAELEKPKVEDKPTNGLVDLPDIHPNDVQEHRNF